MEPEGLLVAMTATITKLAVIIIMKFNYVVVTFELCVCGDMGKRKAAPNITLESERSCIRLVWVSSVAEL